MLRPFKFFTVKKIKSRIIAVLNTLLVKCIFNDIIFSGHYEKRIQIFDV